MFVCPSIIAALLHANSTLAYESIFHQDHITGEQQSAF